MNNTTMNETKLRIAFIGAIDCVSGSCTMLEYTNSEKGICNYYLIDCGEYHETNHHYADNQNYVFQKAKDIRAIFLTHAHDDHIGLLPDLIENGFNGKIYCTEATAKLSKVMLEDAMRINGKNDKEINTVIDKMQFNPIDTKPDFLFGDSKNPIPIDGGLFMYPLRTSHILGSCSFTFTWIKEKKQQNEESPYEHWGAIHFSGDVGPCDEFSVKEGNAQSIVLKDFTTPYYGKTNQYIVLESTYGDRVRDKEKVFTKKIAALSSIISKTKAKGGRVFIPAFALNRMQEVLLDLYYIKHQPRVFTKETFIADNTTEAEFCTYFLIFNSVDAQRIEEQLWEKAFPPPDRVKNYLKFNETALFKDIPADAQDKMVDVLNALYEECQKGLDIDYLYYSSLAKKISGIYSDTLFSSTMNDKKEIKYHYISPRFFDYFTSGIDNPDDRVTKGKELLKKALSPGIKKSQSQQHKKKSNPLEFKDIVGGSYSSDVFVFSNNMLNSDKISELKDFFNDENNVLIITGYQAEGTNGALLKKLSYGKFTEPELYNIKLNGTDIRLREIKCTIKDMSAYYSGHADQEQLVEYVHGFNNSRQENVFPTTVFLNHGTRTQREALKKAIEAKNNESNHTVHQVKAVLPDAFKWFNLNTNEFEESVDRIINRPIASACSAKNKITINDTIDILYPNDFDSNLLIRIIEAVNNILG